MLRVRFICSGFLIAVIFAGISDRAVAADKKSSRTPAITIEAGKTGEPISKYIYGQFIEHLGRCIYGGIWAEMLEDRKFYHSVGSEKSPWEVIGQKNSIEMVSENSYVGKITPEIKLEGQEAAGIAQGGLGLIRGKEYEGRIILAGDDGVRVDVSLVWGAGADERETITIEGLRGEYEKRALKFTAGSDSDDGRLEIVGQGKGSFFVGTVSLMPADNVEGMRADTLKLLKELNSPIYRWPGGNFISGYEWRDGIGERDRRLPRKNLAWNGDESNDFGIDEFMTFCRLIGTEPAMTVNTGFGDAYSAAQEVEYINGGTDTAMGRLRAANGHPEPYNVEWWFVGNEMYGDWQLGHMSKEHYIIKHNLFAEAMRKADASIKLIAVGNAGEWANHWSRDMFKGCAEQMDVISEHFYVDRKEHADSVISYVKQIPRRVKYIIKNHRNYRNEVEGLKEKDIRIAIDEWNYWMGRFPYCVKDALGIAAGLHEMIRNSDIVYMANYAQTVNIMGAIKTSKTEAVMITTGLALKLYSDHFGTVPVEISGKAGVLDVVAAWNKSKDAITVAVVNPAKEEQKLSFDVKGAELTGVGQVWWMAGTDPMAYNAPGEEPKVVIEEKTLVHISNKLTVPPFSISIYELQAG